MEDVLRADLRWAAGGGGGQDPDPVHNSRLLSLLALGSLLAAVVGSVFDSYVEDEGRSPVVVGAMLLAFGIVLFAAEGRGSRRRTVEGSGWRDAL